ncbi:prepilin peptidase, partial [bacterium]|nr:prepilin peptidase [bacterium]
MNIFFRICVFIFGSVIGSFLNVYIFRYCKNEVEKTKESVFKPARSYCPACKKQIAWYDNIPILSYILLFGKCRKCGEKISFGYTAVELFTAFVSLGLYVFYIEKMGSVVYFSIALFLAYAMIALSVVDMKIYLIPDGITIGGVVLGVIVSVVYPDLHVPITFHPFFAELAPRLNALCASIFGIVVGGGVLYLIGVLGHWLFKKDAMGGGDVKLMAMAGALLGYRSVFLILFLASLLGTFVSLFFVLIGKKKMADEIAFGPFLAAAFMAVFVLQRYILLWIEKYIS